MRNACGEREYLQANSLDAVSQADGTKGRSAEIGII